LHDSLTVTLKYLRRNRVQVIAHFKTWRIMHTDYRRLIETLPETISAVIGLHFYRLAE
jgi:hypothetical protein